MKRMILTCTILLFIMGALSAQTPNPFFEKWKTPFQVPPFEQIKNDHYLPAFLEGMKQQKAEIDSIILRKAPPTFKNTIQALDQSGALLEKVSNVFYALNSANTNDEMQGIARKVSPLMSQHRDDINLNAGLFKKIKMVYEQRNKLNLTPDQKRLVEETYKDFVRGGADLKPEQQEKLRALNKEIAMLQLTFGQNLLAENNTYKLIIEKEDELAGLPDDMIQTAADVANKDAETKGKWVFTLHNPSVMPFLQFSDQRALRESIFNAYINRCNHNNEKDNKELITKLVKLRAEKARLMGYSSFAAFALEDRMAKKPENVYHLLDKIWKPALEMAKMEAAEFQEMINQQDEKFSLEAWDWRFYNEKVMKQRFQLDEESLRPYFKLENVRDGIFYVCNKLYGITFTEVKNAPVYHKDVTLYECKEANGTHLGVLYMDFFPRESKRGGAWCGSYRSQSYKNGIKIPPVVTIVCNFSMPSGDKPALLTPDEAETFFHEFGHALHGLFSNVKYNGLDRVPRDFVELPSQIMEHWAFEPEVLKVYAKHYQTGMVIPQDLVDKIEKSGKFGQGFKTTEYLAASYLDMDYHSNMTEAGVPEKAESSSSQTSVVAISVEAKWADIPIPEIDVPSFEEASMKRIGLISQIPPRYRSTYFQHSMTGGYTAGYYSYIWAEVLDADAFQAFKETGNIFDQATARKFRSCILEKGGSKDAMQMYIDFRGHEPGIQALLKNRGLD